jgi:hypothetical protein
MIRKSARAAVFDPRGVVGTERLLAPRIPDLEGIGLGVLDDTKWNANRLLRKTLPGSPARRTGRAPEFRHEALMQRDAFGMPDLVPVVIDHPLSASSDANSDRRPEHAIPQCPRTWLGS